ncbi:DUF3014 domain-containing protein [Sinimarinibacterium thermocellulolyticum]|uniref:DUF3014 domain-containing protein n=1 Tax=Sinimarinibacterium thermocellulolyticum TaxID=3170016 RepID=A0ABV2A9A8_9GAMM
MSKGTRIAVVIALLAGVVGGVWYWFRDRPPQHFAPPVATASPSPADAGTSQGAEYPVAEPPTAIDRAASAPQAAAALPPLDDSDALLRAMLERSFGTGPVEAFLIPNRLVRHIVATVDSLDREPVRLKHRPLVHVQGPLAVEPLGERLYVLSARNYERYDAFVSALDAVDAGTLVDGYLRYYPLFQRAYRELGYPRGDFNERVIAVIDHLVAMPPVEPPVQLLRPKVLYTFADPRLENRSWGQKTLIRMGPAHAETVQRKLAAIRAEILARGAVDSGKTGFTPD